MKKEKKKWTTKFVESTKKGKIQDISELKKTPTITKGGFELVHIFGDGNQQGSL